MFHPRRPEGDHWRANPAFVAMTLVFREGYVEDVPPVIADAFVSHDTANGFLPGGLVVHPGSLRSLRAGTVIGEEKEDGVIELS